MSFSPFGVDLFGDPVEPSGGGAIARRFVVPPFSVLNAREGEWQNRKRAWLSYGIRGEMGRNLKDTSLKECLFIEDGERSGSKEGGGSVFDPVVCELMYKWFCPPGGQILDPFAGGSVRGIVASLLDFKYWGGELRSKQVGSNRDQAVKICPGNQPEWVIGDSLETLNYAPDSDFIFSCPPYGDLEVYCDDPRDLSNMDYHAFNAALKRIVMRTCNKLKNNRFACFVVGDFRDKKGHYRDFVSHTISAFLEQGLHLYNELILITAVGSLPIRITRQFESGRKIGKTHQNVLVFIKGDSKIAAQACNGGDPNA